MNSKTISNFENIRNKYVFKNNENNMWKCKKKICPNYKNAPKLKVPSNYKIMFSFTYLPCAHNSIFTMFKCNASIYCVLCFFCFYWTYFFMHCGEIICFSKNVPKLRIPAQITKMCTNWRYLPKLQNCAQIEDVCSN